MPKLNIGNSDFNLSTQLTDVQDWYIEVLNR